ITKRFFGTTKNGEDVHAYTLENDRGIAVTVLDYGATLQSVVLPHKGERIDVLLGYDTIEEYEQNDGYLGASIGRYAGRIPDAILRIGEDAFPVTANEGRNQLHGGNKGFDKSVWQARINDKRTVQFDLASSDGDEGFPGDLKTSVVYRLYSDTLEILTWASTDRLTAWNPTNHAYWNLNGHEAGDTRKHLLEIPADRYVPVGPDMIPSDGEADVAGTPFDFRTLREIGDTYDNSFVLSGSPIRLWGNSGIGMEITTSCSAVQFYNAKFLGERNGKGGAQYGPFGAVCLETQGRQALRNRPIAPENVVSTEYFLDPRSTKFTFIDKEI
ncbi:MAG: galactose mutarotase, partial [Clostridia bacterium]|nr:galactose mutarotase [Clostridia bacterium]